MLALCRRRRQCSNISLVEYTLIFATKHTIDDVMLVGTRAPELERPLQLRRTERVKATLRLTSSGSSCKMLRRPDFRQTLLRCHHLLTSEQIRQQSTQHNKRRDVVMCVLKRGRQGHSYAVGEIAFNAPDGEQAVPNEKRRGLLDVISTT